MSIWKPQRRPEQSYSGFPAVVVFFAMMLATFALVFRDHLFAGSARARVFLPTDPAAVALVQERACSPASCVASLPK
jgi:hypothetical protein